MNIRENIVSGETTVIEHHKIIQALCYIGSKARARKLGKVHALKIIYLADRYHLRKFGSSITGDTYYAMEMGPVASETKSAIEGKIKDADLAAYAGRYIKSGDNGFQSLIVSNFDELAKTDIESLDAAYDTFLDKGPENIVGFTHRFREWKRHQVKIDAGRSRVLMDMADFFEPSLFENDEYCPADADQVALNREIYLSTPECLRV